MQKIVTNLWFDGNAQEAVDFYLSVFPGSKITQTTYYPAAEHLQEFQKPLAGQVLTINFELHGQLFMAINAGSEFKFTPAVSLLINCKDQAEIDYYFEKLSVVPEAEVCGWLQDKYGLSWQVAPDNIDAIMFDASGQPNVKVFTAMMKMGKLDKAALEAAAGE